MVRENHNVGLTSIEIQGVSITAGLRIRLTMESGETVEGLVEDIDSVEGDKTVNIFLFSPDDDDQRYVLEEDDIADGGIAVISMKN